MTKVVHSPMLAAHRGSYDKDYLKGLVVNRYKDIFLAQSRLPPRGKKKKEESGQGAIESLIQSQVTSFLLKNPLSASKLKELESELRVKVQEIKRTHTMATIPTTNDQDPKNYKAIRKSYNDHPAKRRASLGVEINQPANLKVRRASATDQQAKIAKRNFLSKTVGEDIETALIPSQRAMNGGEKPPLQKEQPKTSSLLPELTPTKGSKRGMEMLGLGGGASTTSEQFHFREKEKDEWHRLIQMEVARDFEEQRRKKIQKLEKHEKFRIELDEQIKERKRKMQQQREEDEEYMKRQNEWATQEEQRELRKKRVVKDMYDRQKEETKQLLVNLRQRREEEVRRERAEERKAAERVKRLFQQDQLKKIKKGQHERDRIQYMMQENKQTQLMLQGQKEIERLDDQKTMEELERRMELENNRRKEGLAFKERLMEARANLMVEKLVKEKNERLKQEERQLQEYQERLKQKAEEAESVREQRKKREKERNQEELGKQIREKQLKREQERIQAQELAGKLKERDLEDLERHGLKLQRVREQKMKNQEELIVQIKENKHRSGLGMSPQEKSLNRAHLSEAEQLLRKYEDEI